MIEIDIQLNKAEFQLAAKFSVPAKGVTAIFGPSGCGKTTLLRALAGLEQGAVGEINIAGEIWLDRECCMNVNERRVGVVFQNPSLFPHLSVEQNLLYGRKRLKKHSKLFDLEEFYTVLGVKSLLARSIQGLSGGEAQRVALGRAMLAEPKLLLVDEPLSALDQATRHQLMSFLENFFQQIDIPVFYVTHSTEEVARLADNLVLMNGGQISGYGPIQQVLGSIETVLSSGDAAFSVLEGKIAKQDLPSLTTVRSSCGIDLQIPEAGGASVLGRRVRLRIRARDVSLCLEQPKGSSILNILPAIISDMSTQPHEGSRIIKLDVAGEQLLSKVSEYSVQQLNLHKGLPVYAQIKSAALLS